MKKTVKLTRFLGCIAAIAIFAAIYCLNRTQNQTLLTIGILSVIIAVASVAVGALIIRKLLKDKYK